MDLGLADKVALVAGASKGLGRAVALGLAQEGARVAILSRDPTRIAAAALEIQQQSHSEVLGISADVNRAEDVQRAVDETVRRFGNLHILVTNAGGPPPSSFQTSTDEQWQQAVNLTLLSAVRLSRAAVPHMQRSKWGRIIHIGSYTVKTPVENLILSNSIRAAVVALGKTQSLELGKDNILVNSVLPGWTQTERVEQLLKDRVDRDGTTLQQAHAAIEKTIPLGRMGRPEEFANVIVFLASECASYVNGTALMVDGGITLTPF
jgi:3-oxoacyl-[acyl-carrier protein] reductase